MATQTPKKRTRYTQEQREGAYALFDQDLSMVQISKQTGIGEMTLAAWKRDRETMKEEATEQSAVEKLASAELENKLLKLQNKFVIRYSKAEDDTAKGEVEIAHLLEVVQLFAEGWDIKRLSALAEEEEDA